jgi:hypothetical protein
MHDDRKCPAGEGHFTVDLLAPGGAAWQQDPRGGAGCRLSGEGSSAIASMATAGAYLYIKVSKIAPAKVTYGQPGWPSAASRGFLPGIRAPGQSHIAGLRAHHKQVLRGSGSGPPRPRQSNRGLDRPDVDNRKVENCCGFPGAFSDIRDRTYV